MNIDQYIRQLEESKARGNKVTSIESALSFARSIRQQTSHKAHRNDFIDDSELIRASGQFKPYTGR